MFDNFGKNILLLQDKSIELIGRAKTVSLQDEKLIKLLTEFVIDRYVA